MTALWQNPIPSIQTAKHQNSLWYSAHCLTRLIERSITIDEVEIALNSQGIEVLENYPDDKRSPSCLLLGWKSQNDALHVIVAYTVNEVVSVYEPKLPNWQTPRQRGGRI